MTYVAMNLSKRAFLRKTKNGWFTTTDITAAYCNSAAKQIEQTISFLENNGVNMEGWTIASTSEASKLIPKKRSLDAEPLLVEGEVSAKTFELSYAPIQEAPVASQIKTPMSTPVVQKTKTIPLTPPSHNAVEIIAQVKALKNLIEPQYRRLLSQQLSIVDKQIVDIYHYIEVTNFNACQGYKACKQLKEALVARRQIKNEMAVILHIDQCGISGVDRLEELSTRAWVAQRDILEGV